MPQTPEKSSYWANTINWFERTAPDRAAFQKAQDALLDLDHLSPSKWTPANPQFLDLLSALPGLGTLDTILTRTTEWLTTNIPPDGKEALITILSQIARYPGQRPQGRAVARLLEVVDQQTTNAPLPGLAAAAANLMATILADPHQHIIGFPDSHVFLPEEKRQALLNDAIQGKFRQICEGLLPYLMGNTTYLADSDIPTAYRTMQSLGEQLSNDNLPFPPELLRIQAMFTLFALRAPPRFTWSERREIQEWLLSQQCAPHGTHK